MSEVDRYDMVEKSRGYDSWHVMERTEGGDWIKAEDYDALRGEVERLREALQLADDWLSMKFPNGVLEGDYLCCAVRAALPTSASDP